MADPDKGEPQLLPCPFCGGDADTESADDSNCIWVQCQQCNAKSGGGPHDALQGIIEGWNQRV